MKPVFVSEYTKGGVYTPSSKHITKRETPMQNREISKDELIALNKETMEKKKKLNH